MRERKLTAGMRLIVSTSDGEEEDEVVRVVVDAVAAGISIVETARNGRVIVMHGRAPGNGRSIDRNDDRPYGVMSGL